MIDNVVIFPAPVRRAVILEQLNEDQWHVYEAGPDLDGPCRCGAVDRRTALTEAMVWAALCGLPVMAVPLDHVGMQPWWRCT